MTKHIVLSGCRASRALGLALVASMFGASACSRPSQAQQTAAVDAYQLFAQACAKCHGPDGAGGLPMATSGPKPIDLRDPAWQQARSDSEIAAAIRDGRGAMPPFTGVLSAAQIEALARHVRTLQAP